jgi:hypothetical protein
VSNPFDVAVVGKLDVQTVLGLGLVLDRKETNRLLKHVAAVDSDLPGHRCMVAQLEAVLGRRDWITIQVSAPSAESLKTIGVTIFVVEAKPAKVWKKKGLSPMQKWQRDNRIGRAF